MSLEGWRKSSLISLLKIMKSGGTPDTFQENFYGGEIPFVAIEDMSASRKYLEYTVKTLTEDGLKNSNAWIVPKNSLLYSIYATLGLVRINKVPVATNQAILAMIVDGNLIDQEYLYYWLEYIRDSVINLSAQTTQSNLSATTVKPFVVQHPKNKKEQEKIAEVLSTVDRAIAQTEALIAKQQRIKTGLMQDLLTKGIDEAGNIRSEETHEFKNSPLGRIPVEWKVEPLHKLTSNIVDCPHTTPNFVDGGVLVARTFNIKDGVFDFENASFVSESEYKERISRLEPKKGDIIFTREAPVGEVFMIPQNMKICLGQRTMLIRCNDIFLNSEYLIETLYSEESKIRFDKISGGTTNPHLNVADVRNLLIKYPQANEQKFITDILKKIRSSLLATQKQKSKLQLIKTGLMQDLLNGKVPVTPLLNK